MWGLGLEVFSLCALSCAGRNTGTLEFRGLRFSVEGLGFFGLFSVGIRGLLFKV